MSERINRIIEIDMDTDRSPMISTRHVSFNKRRGHIPCEENLKEDIIVTVNGLLVFVLAIEASGEVKKGEGIRRAIELLEEGYIDSSSVLSETKNNTSTGEVESSEKIDL